MLNRRIAWLRGDPKSIEVIKSTGDLLRLQGIEIIFPDLNSSLHVDVAVLPSPKSPEEALMKNVRAKYRVRDIEDPWLALSLAILTPSRRFSMVSIGIDPGQEHLGLSAVADNILMWASRVSIDRVASKILWLKSWIPSKRYSVYLGRGQFSGKVAELLSSAGIEYILVDECGTTKAPSRWHVLSRIKDKDTVASVTIALIGMLQSRR